MAGSSHVSLCWLLAAISAVMPSAQSQPPEPEVTAVNRATPFSAWIDLRQPKNSRNQWPIWLETVETQDQLDDKLQPSEHAVRIRFRRYPWLHQYLLVRLQFRDTALAQPTVTAWSETGECAFDSGVLGTGQGLTRTERMIVPLAATDYLEIKVPGSGRDLLAIQLISMKESRVLAPLDFPDRLTRVLDPFSAAEESAPVESANEDLMSRVREVLLKEKVTLSPTDRGASMEVEGPPRLTVLRLKHLDVDPMHPLRMSLNQTPLSPLVLALPELADPAFQGMTLPFQTRMGIRANQLVFRAESCVLAPLDFPDRVARALDPVSAAEESTPAEEADENLMGRVRAVLLKEEVTLSPADGGASLEFELEGPPLLAVLRLKILNVDPLHPPRIYLNNTPVGTLGLALPDLADPAFRGTARPLQTQMTIRYNGWLTAEVALPGELFQAGANSLILRLEESGEPVAVRSVELQMKYNDPSFDYDMAPVPLP